MPVSAKGGRYHHGDLPAALVDAAIDLIAERGVRGFSVAEASRRLGVSVAAPYRHFADRDALLAAVAVRGLQVFGAMITAEADGIQDPSLRLAAMARAYVLFAARERPLFETIFRAGVDKSRYPELQRAWEPVDALLAVVGEICEGDEVAADALATALEATAHGYAVMLLEDEPATGPQEIAAAADRAAAATLAMIAGRAALAAPSPSPQPPSPQPPA